MKKICFMAALAISGVQAQTFELGKVSKAELEEKHHPGEPDAHAAILYQDGKVYLEFSQVNGFSLVTETEVRMKIYDKDGYDWANQSVTYYVGTNPIEHVDVTKAATYNLVNGAIEKTKLKSDGEFDEKKDKNFNRHKISMPAVREGSVIEYRIRVTSPFLNNVQPWLFQNAIPVNYSHYQTRFPEYYDYKVNLRGSLSPKIARSATDKNIVITGSDRTTGANLVTKTSFSSDNIVYRENVTDYVVENAPSMKEESYVNNIRNYVTMAEHELSVIRMPNTQPKFLSTTWDDVVKTIYNNDGFGPELKKNGYFEDDLPAIIAGAADDAAKLAAVFNYVKQRMNWNGYSDYTCDDGVRKAYKAKVGNVAEINLMLTAMLRAAGLKANPVLLSTRANGVAFFPNRSAYNYIVSGVSLNGTTVLLDATDKNALPDILPVRALNWFGRLIRDDGSSESIELAPKSISKDVVFVIANVGTDGKITGKMREQYYDYNAFLYRNQYAALTKDTYLEHLEKQHPGFEVGEFSSSYDDFSKPVTESYDFSQSGAVEIIGDKMYLSPLVFLTTTENPFKQEKREYPVDFVYPHEDKCSVTLNIPDGYEIESLPAPAAVTMPENAGKFLFNIVSSGKSIQVQMVNDVNQAIFSPLDYGMLKDYYKLFIDKQNEKIVLKKV